MSIFKQAVELELRKQANLATLGGPIGAALNFIPEGIDVAGGVSEMSSAEKDTQKELQQSGERIDRNEYARRVARRKQQGKKRAAGGAGGALGTAGGIGAGMATAAALGLAVPTGGASLLAAAPYIGALTVGGAAGGYLGHKGGEAAAGDDV